MCCLLRSSKRGCRSGLLSGSVQSGRGAPAPRRSCTDQGRRPSGSPPWWPLPGTSHCCISCRCHQVSCLAGCSLDAVALVSASVCTEATALPSAQPPRPPVAPAQPLPAPPQGRVSHLQPLQGSSRCRCWCPRWASLAAAWAQPRCAPPPCHLRNKEHRAEVSSVSHPECFCAGPFTFCSL